MRRESALSGWSIRKAREAREGPAATEQFKQQGVVILAEHRAKRSIEFIEEWERTHPPPAA